MEKLSKWLVLEICAFPSRELSWKGTSYSTTGTAVYIDDVVEGTRARVWSAERKVDRVE